MGFRRRAKGDTQAARYGNSAEKRRAETAQFRICGRKSEISRVARLVRIARKQHLDYAGFLYVCQQARRKLDLHKPKKEHRLLQLLSEGDLKRFFRVIQDCGDIQHEIVLKLLFYTAVQVSDQYLRERRRKRAEVYVPLIHRVGDEAQVDSFEVTVELDGSARYSWIGD